MATYGILFHKYQEELQDSRRFNYKLPLAKLHVYGENEELWGEKIREDKMNPYRFLIENGFRPITDDTWILDNHSS